MGAVGRQRAAVAAGLRTTLREPTTVALLVLLPPLVIWMFDVSLQTYGGAVQGVSTGPTEAERGGALFSTAFLAGLMGVFQVVSAAEADSRLVVCGYRPAEVVSARLVAIALASVAVAGVTLATFLLLVPTTVGSPALVAGALVLAAVTYALVGVIVGALSGDELAGSLTLVFLADFDSFTSLESIPTDAPGLEYTPLTFAARLLEDATTTGSIAGMDLVAGLAYVVVLLLAALAIVELRGGIA